MSWKTDKSFVSQYNFMDEVTRQLKLPKRIYFHDVTLRDGEQQAGIVFRKDEKVRIARALDEAGVDRIEAGLPSISKMDMEAVSAIAKLGLQSKVFSFSRCMKSDVDLALKCDVDGVVMEIPSSDHLIKYGYGWTEERAVQLSVEATEYAGRHGLHVAFFTIDSTRAEFDASWRLVNAVATEGHMDSLVLVDTFGVCTPQAMGYFVEKVRQRVDKPIEVHVHNDFGLAMANSLSALSAGANMVHTTVNTIGERCGNVSLEELAMTLRLLYGVETGIKLERLYPLCRLVGDLSGMPIAPNKPIAGENIFNTESGIVVGWWARCEELGMPLEVYPYLPELVGHNPVKIVLGKKSGRDSILYKAKKLGLAVRAGDVDSILERVKTTAEERKRVLTDEEFAEIVKSVSSASA